MEAVENLKAVAKLIEECIENSGLILSFKEMVIRPLTLKGKILSGEGIPKWPFFVLVAYESASGESAKRVSPAAAAMEFLTVAFDILDDLQDSDDEYSLSAGEKAQLLNVSTALMFLAQRAIFCLKEEGFDDAVVLRVLDVVSNLSLQSGNGQHLDILYEETPDVSLDQAIEMTALKAGSLVKCATTIGALLGTDNEELIGLYGELGWHTGIIAQLINDLHDVFPDSSGKSDIRRRKKTVPIAYGLMHEIPSVSVIIGRSDETPNVKSELERIKRERVWKEGGIHYAWVLAQTHLYEAQQILARIEQYRQVDTLRKTFIEPYL